MTKQPESGRKAEKAGINPKKEESENRGVRQIAAEVNKGFMRLR